MNLSAPTSIFFLVSLVLAVIGLLARYGNLNLGIEAFHWVLLAYIVLLVGNLMKRM